MPRKKKKEIESIELVPKENQLQKDQPKLNLDQDDLDALQRMYDPNEPAIESVPITRNDPHGLNQGDALDLSISGQQSEVIDGEISLYTDDSEIVSDFNERQKLNSGGSRLHERLENHTSLDPSLSGGDVDAEWDMARTSGDETIGAHAPTPDQDRVDEIGEGAGLTYHDDEPLDFSKVSRRDRHRWEMNPLSAQDQENPGQPFSSDEEEEESDLEKNPVNNDDQDLDINDEDLDLDDEELDLLEDELDEDLDSFDDIEDWDEEEEE